MVPTMIVVVVVLLMLDFPLQEHAFLKTLKNGNPKLGDLPSLCSNLHFRATGVEVHILVHSFGNINPATLA